MKRWNHTINIKQYLSERDDRDAVEAATVGVLSELDKLPFTGELEFDILVDDFLGIRDDKDCNCDDFNYALNNLYDWADTNRVWLGLI